MPDPIHLLPSKPASQELTGLAPAFTAPLPGILAYDGGPWDPPFGPRSA